MKSGAESTALFFTDIEGATAILDGTPTIAPLTSFLEKEKYHGQYHQPKSGKRQHTRSSKDTKEK
jgi:hypothetical protein